MVTSFSGVFYDVGSNQITTRYHCSVNADGVRPLTADPLPLVCFGLLAHVKAYELLTVEAAVRGDRRAAYQALLVHPLGPLVSRVQVVLDDLLQTNQAYLPAFWAT